MMCLLSVGSSFLALESHCEWSLESAVSPAYIFAGIIFCRAVDTGVGKPPQRELESGVPSLR